MNQSNNDVNENLIDVTEYIPQRKCNYRDLLYSVCLFMNSLLFYGLGFYSGYLYKETSNDGSD